MMKLTPREEEIFDRIYLRILLQLSIETMDKLKGTSAWDGPLRVKMNALYQPIDKSTKMYDELYQASAGGTTEFYRQVAENINLMAKYNLPEQSVLNNMLQAFFKDEKSVSGIIKKVLNSPTKDNGNSIFSL